MLCTSKEITGVDDGDHVMTLERVMKSVYSNELFFAPMSSHYAKD